MSNSNERKLQISNGNYLDFDQLSRILNSISTLSKKDIKFSNLEEETGLPYRQLRNRAAIARAMGILNEKSLILTAFGKLIVEHDLFFENIGTLEYCHYLASGNYNNLVWFDVFNELLPGNSPTEYQGWMNFFMQKYAEIYSESSIKEHLAKEVRFTIEAYLKNRFRKLELLIETSAGLLQSRRHADINPVLFAAMIYKYMRAKSISLVQVEELITGPGTPGLLFGMDEATIRTLLELLHEQNFIRLEMRHGLDQLRIREEYSDEDFLRAFYNGETSVLPQKARLEEGLLL
ncbi:MAG: DUF4007 family protein [Lentisphaerota bacterium]